MRPGEAAEVARFECPGCRLGCERAWVREKAAGAVQEAGIECTGPGWGGGMAAVAAGEFLHVEQQVSCLLAASVSL